MGQSASSEPSRHIATLPDDLMLIVFQRLKFRDKICAGMVCKQWDRLLKDGSANRHCDVVYDFNCSGMRTELTRWREMVPSVDSIPQSYATGPTPFESWRTGCHLLQEPQ